MAYIIDGKKIADDIYFNIKEEVLKIKEKYNIVPKIAVILVGNDPASKVYVKSKEKNSKKMGFESISYFLDEKVSLKEMLDLIETINQDRTINGLLIQLPLPKHIDEDLVLNAIDPNKDVDCFHPNNVGKLYLNKKTFYPCTPHAVLKIIEKEKIQTEKKHIVVIGRSNIVGKPLSILLSSKELNTNATVTIAHSRTENLSFYTKQADILIVAIGKANFIKKEEIKDNAIIIDVGINRLDKKLVGDVDFDDCKEKCSMITPVPGGVGPITISCLLLNTLLAFKEQNNIIL